MTLPFQALDRLDPLLLQAAQTDRWPERLDKLNNVALVQG